MVMVDSVLTYMFVGRLFSFLVTFHLVLYLGELVASVDSVNYERRSWRYEFEGGTWCCGWYCFLRCLATSGASGSFWLVVCWGIFIPP